MSKEQYLVQEDAGCDWITSAYSTGVGRELHHYQNVSAIAAIELAKGNQVKPFHMRGYQGDTVGKLSYGTRTGGHICVLRSWGAETYGNRWPELFCHASRIDVQVTLRCSDTILASMHRSLQEASAARAARPEAQRFRLDTFASHEGLTSIYIGSRTSEQHGIIYNKEVESGEERYRGCYRFEVRLVGPLARAIGHMIYSTAAPVSQLAPGIVRNWFAARGVTVPVYVGGPGFDLPTPSARDTDDARSMAWLTTQVRPTVERLVDVYGMIAVLDALGLSEMPPELDDRLM